MRPGKVPLLIAGILLLLELLLGLGVLGGTGFFVAFICVGIYFLDGKTSRELLRVAFIFAVLGVASLLWIMFNSRVAERRALPIIKACEAFRRSRGRYPASLDDLVPQFISSIPNARCTLVANRYGYSAEKPSLNYAVMFHGVATYDFESYKWWTND